MALIRLLTYLFIYMIRDWRAGRTIRRISACDGLKDADARKGVPVGVIKLNN